jgi:hypothetical protein
LKNKQKGTIDRRKHDEDIAERMIGGVRSERSWNPRPPDQKPNTAHDRPASPSKRHRHERKR